jgi:hypothetical protein
MIRTAALAALLATTLASAQTSPRRPVPDYDGRPEPPPTALEVVAWFPRVVFFPLWLVSEFLVRRPLGWLIVTAERGEWPSEILSFFTFGGRKDLGLVPTFYVDLGFRPTAGFYLFWDDALHPRHSVRLRASAWYDGYAFSLADRWRVDDAGSRLQLRAEASRTPDLTFHGIGPRTLDADETRFSLDRVAAEVSFDWRLGFGDVLRFSAAVRDHTLRDEPVGPDEWTSLHARIDASQDTRDPWPHGQTGVRVAAFVEGGTALGELGSWVRAGATAGAFWDVVGLGRVVGLTATAAIVDPIDGELPFFELVPLGGGAAMAGLRPRRLLGQSALSASLRYEWPVWAALAGSLQVDVGNVFGPTFEGFDPELLRLSTAIGLRSMGPSDHELQFILGVGTETFAQGAALTSVRLAFGGTYGF